MAAHLYAALLRGQWQQEAASLRMYVRPVTSSQHLLSAPKTLSLLLQPQPSGTRRVDSDKKSIQVTQDAVSFAKRVGLNRHGRTGREHARHVQSPCSDL